MENIKADCNGVCTAILMENSKLDCRSVCTAILGYGTPVETLDGKYQSGLLLSSYSNIKLWDCGRDT